jgi:hypothetical protein
MKKIKELLPIGSVISLQGGFKKLMIFGVMQSDGNGEDYDYIGVIYPEGNIGEKGKYLFQHKDIETVYFKGFENDEREEFIKKLEEFYQKRN